MVGLQPLGFGFGNGDQALVTTMQAIEVSNGDDTASGNVRNSLNWAKYRHVDVIVHGADLARVSGEVKYGPSRNTKGALRFVPIKFSHRTKQFGVGDKGLDLSKLCGQVHHMIPHPA